jgi:hypothetical protein
VVGGSRVIVVGVGVTSCDLFHRKTKIPPALKRPLHKPNHKPQQPIQRNRMPRQYQIHLANNLLLEGHQQIRMPTPPLKVTKYLEDPLAELLGVFDLFEVFDAVALVAFEDLALVVVDDGATVGGGGL